MNLVYLTHINKRAKTMHKELEILETLMELRSLYRSGELREYDFDVKISTVEQEVRSMDDAVTEMEKEYLERVGL